MKALLTNYHQSPQKVRLIANLVRGKSVAAARMALTYQPQKSSEAILKLLNSAVANASNNNSANADDLFIKTIEVNKGAVLRRFMPKARGRAARYAKTMSIIALELGVGIIKKGKKATKTVKTDEAAKVTKSAQGGSASGRKRASKKVVAATE